jgi:hypothetical protein
MTTTNLDPIGMRPSSVESSRLKTLCIEPLLVVGVSAFWLFTLPFVGVALSAVKVWDTLTSRPNPLILRRGAAAGNVLARQHPDSMTEAAHV